MLICREIISAMMRAVNVPQSKTVTIVLLLGKHSVFGVLATRSLECSNGIGSLNDVLQMFFTLTLIVDCGALVYFCCQRDFRCLEYYVWYAFNLIVSLVVVLSVISVNVFEANGDCAEAAGYGTALLSSCILVQINAVVVMWSHLYFALKFVHFGSNMAWPCIWFFTVTTSPLISFVSFVHLLLSLTSLLVLLVSRCVGKTAKMAKSWRIITIVSIGTVFFCYFLVVVASFTSTPPPDSVFFYTLYLRIAWLDALPPILLLLYLHGQTGDPREKIIKRYEEVFLSLHEHQYISKDERI